MGSAVIGSGVRLWCAMIDSGAHVAIVTMVAMVDNSSGIHKSFMNSFNGIFVVQTKPMLHTLNPLRPKYRKT